MGRRVPSIRWNTSLFLELKGILKFQLDHSLNLERNILKPTQAKPIKGQQTFSIKGQIANLLGFVGHMVFVTATQLYPYNVKADIDST